MKSYFNIEKLPGKDYYTGYSTFSGVWHIRRCGKRWYARCQRDDVWIGAFFADTLREASSILSSK